MKLYVDEWWVINEMTWNLNDRWFCVLGIGVEGINVFWNGLIVPGRKKDLGRQVLYNRFEYMPAHAPTTQGWTEGQSEP